MYVTNYRVASEEIAHQAIKMHYSGIPMHDAIARLRIMYPKVSLLDFLSGCRDAIVKVENSVK